MDRRATVCHLGALTGGLVLAAVSLIACGDDDTDTASSTTATTASTTTTSAGPTEFPPARAQLEHGQPTWAVVLDGAGDPNDPALTAAVAAAADAGYETGPTDCDEGAPEAIGFQDETGFYTVSVYFETQADAEQALAAFRADGVEGGAVAEVTTFCLD